MCTCMCVHVRYNVHMYHSCTTHVAIITTAYMYDTFTCIICMWYSCPLYKIDINIYLCRVTRDDPGTQHLHSFGIFSVQVMANFLHEIKKEIGLLAYLNNIIFS